MEFMFFASERVSSAGNVIQSKTKSQTMAQKMAQAVAQTMATMALLGSVADMNNLCNVDNKSSPSIALRMKKKEKLFVDF